MFPDLKLFFHKKSRQITTHISPKALRPQIFIFFIKFRDIFLYLIPLPLIFVWKSIHNFHSIVMCTYSFHLYFTTLCIYFSFSNTLFVVLFWCIEDGKCTTNIYLSNLSFLVIFFKNFLCDPRDLERNILILFHVHWPRVFRLKVIWRREKVIKW